MEPIEKALRKDKGLLEMFGGVIGILPTCEITDNEIYSKNHPWDWLNE